jgi:hypothetical protein
MAVVLSGGRGQHVDRVSGRSRRGQEGRQLLAHRFRKLRHGQAAGLARVGAQDRRTTGIGDDGDPVAGGQRLAAQQERGVEEFGQRVSAYDARLLEKRVDGDVRSGQQGPRV